MLNNQKDKHTTLGTISIARNSHGPFRIANSGLNEHFYIIGRSGTDKSNLLKQLAIADMDRGAGLCFIDPIGSTAEELLSHVPTNGKGKSSKNCYDASLSAANAAVATGRDKDVIYIDAADVEFPIGINPLYNVAKEDRARAVSDILQMFESIWHDCGWGPRMESIFRATLHTLIENPNCIRPSLLTVFGCCSTVSFATKPNRGYPTRNYVTGGIIVLIAVISMSEPGANGLNRS